MLTTIAAAGEPTRGWGGPIAIVVAVAVFITYATLLDWWQRRRDLPSPTEGDTPVVRVNTQVDAVSDTDDTDADTGWWGRIVERGGRRVRAAEEPVDEELDLELEEPETMEDAIARMEAEGRPYMEIVRQVMDDFEVSEATAKRRIREVRAERASAA